VIDAMRIAAVVPAFNEARSIGAVVKGARAHVDDVIVVDDGSTDGTGTAAAEVGAHVVAHGVNRGKGWAIRTGLAAALSGPCTHVLMMDGDLQHRPSDIPALVAAARVRDADVVVGARVFDRKEMPRARYYSNVIGSRALSGLIGAPVSDSQSGFRLFRADVLRDLPLTSSGYEIETEMLIRLARRGARIIEVPVTLAYGSASKLRPVRDTTRTCFLALYYRFLCPR
jgi:glycosyltransferase involved in cell wall biosynthesis